MKVSVNTIKQYIDFELPPVDELVKRINEQLGGVEAVIDLNAKYNDAVIVKVVECQKHPDADRLNVTKIDDGGVAKDVPRDENGLVQVVCGAPNVHADMFAIWLPPKSTVPASWDDKERFVLDARELRGVLSQGMLAAADELAIGTDHDGIIEINPGEWKPSDIEIKPGASFASVYGLNDTIIDIENKMFTHRPDLFGQLGVAREIAGIFGHKFVSPSWYLDVPRFESGEGLELKTFNEATDSVPRIMFAAMKNIEIKPSPLWLQCALVAMGSKPINNIVDVTNYVMLLTAQPTHAYDYDKIRGHTIGARMAKDGEKATLLNGKTYELTKDDIVIADGEGLVGLGGIMGGSTSEVDENTKNIIIEVATFDMYSVRKSSMRHGIFTDALTRFNKGQSSLQNDHIMNLLMVSIKDVSPAEQASAVFDQRQDGDKLYKAVSLNQAFINDRLGLRLSPDETKHILENVEMKIDGEFEVMPPFWRTDIELPEDIVEEVGRLYGFDKLPHELPMRTMKPATKSKPREMKHLVREKLSRSGANEVLTYSFVHENIMKKVSQDSSHAFQLSNALSPDLQFYRLSLMPSLLDKLYGNLRAGYEKFAIFEIGRTHFKGEMDMGDPNLPNEDSHVALLLTYGDKQKPDGGAYYQARHYLESIAEVKQLHLMALADFDTSADEWGKQLTAAYDPSRSAVVVKDNKIWGVVGEFLPEVRKAFKLPLYTAGFEVHLDLLGDGSLSYKPLSKYPSVTQDLSLKITADTSYQTVQKVIWQTLAATQNLAVDVSPVAIYQSKNDTTTKTVTFRIKATSYEKTLREEEVTSVLDSITEAVNESQPSE